jgi:uncharacterized protein YxjI
VKVAYTNLQDAFNKASNLFIRQKREMAEILIGFETKNQYAIMDEDKNVIGAFAEQADGIFDWILRTIFRSHRPLQVHVADQSAQVLLHLSRKFFFFFSDLYIHDQKNQAVGSVHRRFAIIYKKYDLRDSTGQTFATISSPIWRLWTFPIFDQMGQQRGAISKKWGGALREMFTDADTYLVDFGQQWRTEQRTVIFAAAICIDFDFFEDNSNSSGVFG